MAISKAVSESLKIYLALGGGGLALAWRFIPAPWARRILAALVLVASVGYIRASTHTLTTRLDSYDVIHYYLNAKYFSELGYYDLYPAVLTADEEAGPRWDTGPQYMAAGDEGDHMAPIAEAYRRGKVVKAGFSTERWSQFKHDFLVIRDWKKGIDSELWRQMVQDHGYNGTPAWTLQATPFVRLVPVEFLKVLAYLDVALLAAALAAVVWAYDLDAALFVALFLFTTYSTRWPIIGTAFLRYDYVSAMIIAMCCLKRGRPFAAGLFGGWAGVLRLFPAAWMFGPAFKGLFGLTRRELSRPLLRLAGGFLLAAALLQGGSALLLGPEALATHSRDIKQHTSAEELSSRRAGLALALPFRGDLEPKNISRRIKQDVEDQARLRYAVGGAFLLVLAWALRRSDDDEAYAFGFAPFLVFATAIYYYYVTRVTLILAHASRRDSWRHATGLAMLFAVDAFSNWSEVNRPGHRVYLIGWLGWMLVVYLVVMTGWLLWEGRRRQPDTITSP